MREGPAPFKVDGYQGIRLSRGAKRSASARIVGTHQSRWARGLEKWSAFAKIAGCEGLIKKAAPAKIVAKMKSASAKIAERVG